jgi:hypothetical protein
MCLTAWDIFSRQIFAGGSLMQMKKIKEIAKKKGVTAGSMGRTELIRAIQKAEGNPDCFATMHINACDEMNCLWRVDCKAEVIAQADIPFVSSCI